MDRGMISVAAIRSGLRYISSLKICGLRWLPKDTTRPKVATLCAFLSLITVDLASNFHAANRQKLAKASKEKATKGHYTEHTRQR